MGPFWLKIEPNNTLADPSLKLQALLNFLQIFSLLRNEKKTQVNAC